jgi:hypothetical protein
VQTITKQPRVDLGQMDEHHPEISDTASSWIVQGHKGLLEKKGYFCVNWLMMKFGRFDSLRRLSGNVLIVQTNRCSWWRDGTPSSTRDMDEPSNRGWKIPVPKATHTLFYEEQFLGRRSIPKSVSWQLASYRKPPHPMIKKKKLNDQLQSLLLVLRITTQGQSLLLRFQLQTFSSLWRRLIWSSLWATWWEHMRQS